MIPELLADGPSQVWTWDITKLRGPTKGVWFHLYVLIDIYSRYNPLWIVAAYESAELAAEFIAEAIERNGIAPHTVHADRGTSMTSGLVSELLTNLGIVRSHSRPRMSNDNPFSEAQFKTLKYLHDFPKSFASLEDARVFSEGFFNEYNHIHRHSGIAWHTPASVLFGTADAVDEARQITLNEARREPGSVFTSALPARNADRFLHQRTRCRIADQLIVTVSLDLTHSAFWFFNSE
ncbi:transposase [Rhodococcus sp. NPDC057135]|uniref:transposase n=1 Tax=Rhodococcus sp. NPDC057135 TaxID=3346028 RepID=UPI003625BF51